MSGFDDKQTNRQMNNAILKSLSRLKLVLGERFPINLFSSVPWYESKAGYALTLLTKVTTNNIHDDAAMTDDDTELSDAGPNAVRQTDPHALVMVDDSEG